MKKILQPIDETHFLFQYPDGFSFGTDAVLLSGFIRCRKRSVGVELGTGTGIIPILLSIHKDFQKIYALEIQPEYAELARENVSLNHMEDQIEVIEGDLKEASRLVPAPCDFVFSNPPYMKKNSGKINDTEAKCIARHEISCDIYDVCRSASSLLQDKGDFFCVYRMQRLCDLLDAMRQNNLEPKDLIPVISTPNGEPYLVLVRAVKGAASDLRCRSPFWIQDADGNRTKECQLLYETGTIPYGRNS